MLSQVKNYINSLEENNSTKDLLNDIVFLTEDLNSDCLVCDLRGDVDVVEGLTDELNKMNINKVYYPVDQMNCDSDIEDFEKFGWTNQGSKLVGEYEDEVFVLVK